MYLAYPLRLISEVKPRNTSLFDGLSSLSVQLSVDYDVESRVGGSVGYIIRRIIREICKIFVQIIHK